MAEFQTKAEETPAPKGKKTTGSRQELAEAEKHTPPKVAGSDLGKPRAAIQEPPAGTQGMSS